MITSSRHCLRIHKRMTELNDQGSVVAQTRRANSEYERAVVRLDGRERERGRARRGKAMGLNGNGKGGKWAHWLGKHRVDPAEVIKIHAHPHTEHERREPWRGLQPLDLESTRFIVVPPVSKFRPRANRSWPRVLCSCFRLLQVQMYLLVYAGPGPASWSTLHVFLFPRIVRFVSCGQRGRMGARRWY